MLFVRIKNQCHSQEFKSLQTVYLKNFNRHLANYEYLGT